MAIRLVFQSLFFHANGKRIQYAKKKYYYPKDMKLDGMIYRKGIELRASGIITIINSRGVHDITVTVGKVTA